MLLKALYFCRKIVNIDSKRFETTHARIARTFVAVGLPLHVLDNPLMKDLFKNGFFFFEMDKRIFSGSSKTRLKGRMNMKKKGKDIVIDQTTIMKNHKNNKLMLEKLKFDIEAVDTQKDRSDSEANMLHLTSEENNNSSNSVDEKYRMSVPTIQIN